MTTQGVAFSLAMALEQRARVAELELRWEKQKPDREKVIKIAQAALRLEGTIGSKSLRELHLSYIKSHKRLKELERKIDQLSSCCCWIGKKKRAEAAALQEDLNREKERYSENRLKLVALMKEYFLKTAPKTGFAIEEQMGKRWVSATSALQTDHAHFLAKKIKKEISGSDCRVVPIGNSWKSGESALVYYSPLISHERLSDSEDDSSLSS